MVVIYVRPVNPPTHARLADPVEFIVGRDSLNESKGCEHSAVNAKKHGYFACLCRAYQRLRSQEAQQPVRKILQSQQKRIVRIRGSAKNDLQHYEETKRRDRK